MLEKKIIKKQKSNLLKEKKEIEKTLSVFAKKSKTKGSHEWQVKFPRFGGDIPLDEEGADEVEAYTDLLSVKNRLESRLIDIENALEKIKNKKGYGTCEKCKKRIQKGRLEAIPEAKFCSKCAKLVS